MHASHKPKKILAFDWDAQRVRVVSAVLTKRGPRVDRLLSANINSDIDVNNAAQMGGFLKQILAQEGLSASHAIVDIPRDQAILNTLSLPTQVPEELPAIVAMQVAKQLPFAVADAVVDFAVGPHAPDAATGDVLVAAVRREVLKHYESVFEAAGLKLIRVGLRPYANKLAVCELLKHALPERVLFVDVGPALTEINIYRNGFLSFSRAASVMVPPPEQRATPVLQLRPPLGESLEGAGELRLLDTGRTSVDVVSSLSMEVAVSIEAYRASDPGAKLDHAVIGGDLGVEEALADALQQKLRITAEVYNPGATFGWEPDEGAKASACAATLGLVLGYAADEVLQFDFLHPKKHVSVTEQRLRRAPLVAAVGFLFLAAAGIALAAYTKPDRMKLADLESKIKELSAKSAENNKFLAAVKEVRDFENNQQVWVDVLLDIMRTIPAQEELVIHQIDLNQREGKVLLKSRAKHRATSTDAIRKLGTFRREGKEKPRFRAVMRGLTEKSGESYPFAHDFVIEILNDEGKAKKRE